MFLYTYSLPILTIFQISTGQFQHLTYRVITMVRGGLISMLYGKAAELSITAVDPSSSMILMSADIERITTGWQTMHELWANLIEVGLAIYLLERQLGAACAVPIAVAISTFQYPCHLNHYTDILSFQFLWSAHWAQLPSSCHDKPCGSRQLKDVSQLPHQC